MLDIKPLLDKNLLVDIYWSQLKEGFKEVLKYGTGDDDLAKIFQDIMNDQLIVWYTENDEQEILGFITTQLQIINTYPEQRYLLLNHGWQAKGVKPFLYTKDTFSFLDGYAKQLGCTKIKTYTIRNIERYYNKVGFTKSYTEYQREVNCENL